jgi:hypothetical protein
MGQSAIFLKGPNMGDFISWTEKTITTKGVSKKHVVFFTDYDVYNTPEGAELLAYCGDSSDAIGHGGLCRFYKFNGNTIPHLECTSFDDASRFPEEIADAIREGKMDRLMHYAHHSQLSDMLLPRLMKEIVDYSSIAFRQGVPEKTQKEVLDELEYEKDRKEVEWKKTPWSHKKNIGNICAFFRWTNTRKGFAWWSNVVNSVLVNTREGSGMNYDKFIELWKDPMNRIEQWRPRIKAKTEKPKRVYKPRRKKVLSAVVLPAINTPRRRIVPTTTPWQL